jgi:hypothetical protein
MLARAMVLSMTITLGLPATAADDDTLRKDLTAVIALRGLPCGEVTRVERKAENDYVASCKDGNRYRVQISEQGRVVVTKQ